MGLCGDFTFFGHVIRQMQLLLLTMEILLERNDRSLVLCGIQELTISVVQGPKVNVVLITDFDKILHF